MRKKFLLVFIVLIAITVIIIFRSYYDISRTFINVKDGRMSDYFGYVVAYSSDKVVYPIFEQGTMKIIVQDIYNRDNYYLEIIRDYIRAATGIEIISDVYFLDDETLYLTYFSGENYDKITEIIDLSNP